MDGSGGDPRAAVADRVAELFASYQPPDFAHVPDADAALFLCAMDHRTGYEGAHSVDGEGPFEGSELLWAAGLRSARRRPGLLTAATLAAVTEADVASAFEVDGETVADPDRRAALWRDLAAGLARDHGGSAARLLASADGRLGGAGGLLARLAPLRGLRRPAGRRSRSCSRRSALVAAGSRSPTRRAGRSRPTTC